MSIRFELNMYRDLSVAETVFDGRGERSFLLTITKDVTDIRVTVPAKGRKNAYEILSRN